MRTRLKSEPEYPWKTLDTRAAQGARRPCEHARGRPVSHLQEIDQLSESSDARRGSKNTEPVSRSDDRDRSAVRGVQAAPWRNMTAFATRYTPDAAPQRSAIADQVRRIGRYWRATSEPVWSYAQ